MSTKDRKLLEKENRRESILAAAETIMSSQGIHGLNVDLIAQETQLAKGTIYLYFRSKEEILATLTLRARIILFQAFKEAAATTENPIEQIKNIIYANYNLFKTNSLQHDLVSLYETNSQLTETPELQATSNDITNLVVQIAQKAQQNGSLSPSMNPYHFTACMWGMTTGIHQLMKIRGKNMQENQNISEQDLLDSYVQILINGMKI
jgi:TetR/AcrR family transcriptional regulator